jgi:hypothetical protein
MGREVCVSLALVTTSTLTAVTIVVQLFFTIYTSNKYTSINALILNGNHRHVCMYANVILISHTKLVCENVVFSEPCCLESKCGVGKVF